VNKTFGLSSPVFIYIFSLFLLTSCGRHYSFSQATYEIRPLLFIAMPQNVLVHENISPLFYTALRNHFHRLHYRLVPEPEEAFVLETKVLELSSSQKFISPDVVLYGYRLRIVVECSLVDPSGKIIARRPFTLSSLMSTSKNPILDDHFVDFELCGLLKRVAAKVGLWVEKAVHQKDQAGSENIA